jgi:hypothetical protein
MSFYWVKRVELFDNRLTVYYPTRLIGRKEISWSTKDIEKVSFVEYFYNNPSHLRFKLPNGKIEVDCSLDEGVQVLKKIHQIGVTVETIPKEGKSKAKLKELLNLG